MALSQRQKKRQQPGVKSARLEAATEQLSGGQNGKLAATAHPATPGTSDVGTAGQNGSALLAADAYGRGARRQHRAADMAATRRQGRKAN